jgi:hypothetical protein
MNRRTEARFQVYSRAQLILLDQPERELNVSLTDMSGTGFQMLADEAVPAGKKVVVETDAHLILAEVRHSRRRGERYAVGAQRVHTLPKLDLPDQASRVEKIQILINDHQLKLGKETAVPASVVSSPVIQPERKVEDHAAMDFEDIFEPQPSAVFNAIPRAANPAVPKLTSAPSDFLGFA